MKKRTLSKLLLLSLFLGVFIQNTNAQYHRDFTEENDKWHLALEPYMMLSYMDGKAGIKNLPSAEVKQKAKDIFSNLEMGGMLYGELYNNNWSISTDLIYMKLGSDIKGKHGILSGNAEMKQFNWEVAGMYRFASWFEAGIAVQLNSLKTTMDMTLTGPSQSISKSGSLSETWIDPSVVVRGQHAFGDSKKWFIQFRGNAGGFGVGSDLYWQAQAYAGYRFSQTFYLSGGYRAIKIDYENGKGDDYFLYDMLTHGPVVKLGFNIF